MAIKREVVVGEDVGRGNFAKSFLVDSTKFFKKLQKRMRK